MKIGRNDSTLAHALAKGAAGEQFHRDVARLHSRVDTYVGKRTMKGAFRELRAVFGERVIYEQIDREKGSRAKGFLFILEPLSGGDMVLIMIAWAKGQVKQHSTPVVVTRHALARLMQRTVGEADLPACIERLRSYVMVGTVESVAAGLEKTKDMDLTVAGKGGALMFRREGRMLVAKTWMDSEMMADPKLRAAANDPDFTTWWSNP